MQTLVNGHFRYEKIEIEHIHPFEVSGDTLDESHFRKTYKMKYFGEAYMAKPHGIGTVKCKEAGFKGVATF